MLALLALGADSPGLALGTEQRRRQAGRPGLARERDAFEVIALKDGDEVVGAVELARRRGDLVFVTSDAQLLRFPASAVRPQGRAAGGMAGIGWPPAPRVVSSARSTTGSTRTVLTVSGASAALPGTGPGSAKVTPFAEYPAKGRGTGGVRCHRFLKGEDTC